MPAPARRAPPGSASPSSSPLPSPCVSSCRKGSIPYQVQRVASSLVSIRIQAISVLRDGKEPTDADRPARTPFLEGDDGSRSALGPDVGQQDLEDRGLVAGHEEAARLDGRE